MLRIEAPEGRIRAAITLPGSKSISNRLLILREVLGEDFEIQNLSDSDDTRILAQALEMVRTSETVALDISQAGTDMRFLTAFLSAREGSWSITGSERMKQRPIAPLVDALRSLGADIRYLERDGYPPLHIDGKKLSGRVLSIKADVSSQFISALLLIAPLLPEGLVVFLEGKSVSRPYISMSLGLLGKFGFKSLDEPNRLEVFPRQRKRKTLTMTVEPDWSAASYYYSVTALAENTSIELRHLAKKSLQADAVVADIFSRLGVKTVYRKDSVTLCKVSLEAQNLEYDFSACPDLAQTLAVVCFGMGILFRFTGLQTLKIKETDRIAAMAAELEKLGGSCEHGPDFLYLKEINHVTPDDVIIETYGDHRMAMSFAPLALRKKRLFINDEKVVAKSYPRFWNDFASLGFHLNLQP